MITSVHAMSRMAERCITFDDVICGIKNGKIIEQYPNDYPYPSCLVVGFAIQNKYVHVVVSDDGERLWIVTAYFPDAEKWDKTFERRVHNEVQ